MTNEKPKYSEILLTRRTKVYDFLLNFCKTHNDKDLLAFTQTFKASSIDGAPISKQIHCKMVDLFIPLSSCSSFVILPEVHTSGKKYGSIHFHGLLCVNKQWKWYNKVLPFLKSLGFVTVKPVFELTKWIDYLIKDHATFIRCPIDDYLIFNEFYIKRHKNNTLEIKSILPV